ncbi:MAG: DUF4340 domain-containing protein [Magnetococcales bacterium]|nr:DUF4340 domain-containing protein [Magnetococcales bacterium]MBF0149600.1 DUF4340 domain-containing protein [Magnetococcales bacterium]
MEKIIRNLTLVLVLQLVLAVVLGLSGSDLATQVPDTTLVSFKAADIDGISIEGEGSTLTLARKDGRWILPEHKGLPANPGQVSGLLESLSNLKHGLPVATSVAAQTRFKVAEKEFERKIVLSQNSAQKAVLYFGTSPGLRQVHARSDGMEATLSVAFANHQAPVKVDDWLDKSMLAIPMEEIEAIEVAGLTMTREEVAAAEKENKEKTPTTGDAPKKEPQWKIQPLAQGETPNQEEVAKLARTMAHLSIDGLEAADAEITAAMDKPSLELAIKRKDGTRIVFKVAKIEKKNLLLVKSSAREELFRIAGYVGDNLLKNAKKEVLLTLPAKKEEKASTPPPQSTLPVEPPGIPAASTTPPPQSTLPVEPPGIPAASTTPPQEPVAPKQP